MYLSGWTRRRLAASSEAHPPRVIAAKVIAKIGKVHLLPMCDRLSRQFGIAVVTTAPILTDAGFFSCSTFCLF
jgi:hypothetical protein